MKLYDDWILPRLTDLVMRHKEISRYRERVVPQASGIVLEIGAGSGLNLRLYGSRVERLYALDPSPALLRMARRKKAPTGVPVAFVDARAEAIPIPDASVDAIVTTFTLCTISDPLVALREMKRVLRPGGRLLFAEHGLAPEPSVQRWQQRCNPLWRRMAGGCNLDRPIDALIEASGFRLEHLATEYAKGPRPLAYMYWGAALSNGHSASR